MNVIFHISSSNDSADASSALCNASRPMYMVLLPSFQRILILEEELLEILEEC